uniref:SpaH n=1 Tax=Spirochaeta aurantia TaxID=147 RepID=Q0PI00_SPIAU|nr:SpaH [Spirochaeta aurantia]
MIEPSERSVRRHRIPALFILAALVAVGLAILLQHPASLLTVSELATRAGGNPVRPARVASFLQGVGLALAIGAGGFALAAVLWNSRRMLAVSRGIPSALQNPGVLVVLFCVVFLVARIPFYAAPLRGEDGQFAVLFLDHPSGPNYGAIGRIDGREIFHPLGHPAPMYELVSWLGAVVQTIVPMEALDEAQTEFLIRLAFSLFSLAILVPFLFWARRVARGGNEVAGRLMTLVVFLVAVSPLATSASADLQVDGTSGFLAFGVVAHVVLALSEQRTRVRAAALGFIAGSLVGLGKQEWSLALLMSGCVTLVGLWFLSRRKGAREMDRTWLVYGLTSTVGCLVANAASYAFDPINYQQGLDILFRLSGGNTIANRGATWLPILAYRLPFTAPLLIAAGVLIVALLRRSPMVTLAIQSFPGFYLATLSVALFVPYFFSSWGSTGRYFVPASVALLGLLFVVLRSGHAPQALRTWGLSLGLVGVLSLAFWCYQGARVYFQIDQVAQERRALDVGSGVRWLGIGDVYHRSVDYIADSMSLSDAQAIARGHGKELRGPNGEVLNP